MRKTWPRLAMLWFVWLSFAAVVFAQSSVKPNRSVPKLTNEDMQPAASMQPVVTETDIAARSRPSPGNEVESGGGIVWRRDPNEAANLARPGNKLIIVDVYTNWCGWCKKMDQEIYTDPRVAALSRQDVFLKLNAEDRGAGEEFARQAGVNRFPTTLILDSEGRVLDTKTGFMQTPDVFLQFVKRARASR